MTIHLRPNSDPREPIDFEEWMRRPVYVAQCRAYKIMCEAYYKGMVNEAVLNCMHMLKSPLQAPHLPEWPDELMEWQQKRVKLARDIAAVIIKSYRLTKRLKAV